MNATLKRMAALLAALMVLLFALPAFADYDMDHPENLTNVDLNARACILIEAESGDVIYAKNADMRMYPASTTKVLTLLLACKYADMDATTVVSPYALFRVGEGSSVLGIYNFEEINIKDLLYGTMLTSGNDGANVIAEAVTGDMDSFVDLMNRAAQAYGCTNTHFVNPSGYHDPEHYTTARDMATITRIAMQDPLFADIANCTKYTIPKTNMSSKRDLVLVNNWYRLYTEEHADCYYEYGSGIKTGHTSDAGYCYVGSAEKNGVKLISVVLGCTSRARSYTDTIKLMEYGFSQYVSTTVEALYNQNPAVVEISGYATDDANVGKLELKLHRVSAEGDDTIVTSRANLQILLSNLRSYTVTEYTRQFDAPINEGEVMGTLSYYAHEGAEPVVYELTASRSIARREDLAPTIEQIKAAVAADPNPFPPLTIELVLLLLVIIGAPILLFRLLRALIRRLKKRPHHKNIKPTERYFV